MARFYNFNFLMLAAVVLGTGCGFLSFKWTTPFSETVIELFVNCLKLLSLPVIFLSILSTLSSMKNLSEAGVLLKKILKYTLLTTLIAATIALLTFVMINPVNTSLTKSLKDPSLMQGSYLTFLKQIIPFMTLKGWPRWPRSPTTSSIET